MSTEFKDWLLQFYAKPSHTLMLLDLQDDGNVIGYYYHAWDEETKDLYYDGLGTNLENDKWMLY
jgi:hypothetical protein